MSLFERINTKLIREKKEPLSDKEKYYRDRISQKAKDLGYKSGSELERTVDRGIKAVDKKPGGRYPKVGYATGEPFQPDNNPKTVKYVKDKKGFPVKVPGTGKFPASGKSTLRGRFRYPSMDKDFSSAVKTGEVERDVAKRLKTRLGYTAKDELGDIKTPQGKKNIDDFVSKVMKNQKGTIGTGTGKDSDLYKILKRDIDNRNPTVPGEVINPKTGTRFRKPMPGGFDADGGRTGTKARQNRYDMTAQRRAAKFDKEIAKQANLPKDLKIPKGGSGDSTPLSKKELNVKYKAAKMKLDYGGRMAKRDPKYQAMTSAQKKANFEKLKKTIYNKKSSQPFKGPQTFSTYKYDRKNIVPTGLKGKGQPKFKDIRNTIPYRSTTKDRLKLGKRDLSAFSKKMKFGRLRTPTKAIKYKKTFGDFAKQAGKSALKFGMNNKRLTAVGLGLAAAGAYFGPKIFGGKKDEVTFKKSSVIKNKSGDDVTFKYPTYSDRKVKDNLLKKDPNLKLDPYKNYSDGSYKPNIRNASTGFLGRNKNKQRPFTDKFKSGEFKVDDVPKSAIRGGDKFDLNKNLATSAFEKQLQKAEKGSGRGYNPLGKNFLKRYQTKADKKFLKKYSNATRPT